MGDNISIYNDITIKKKTRILWIDNLKFIAAYGVVLGHCYSMFIGQNDYGKEQVSSFIMEICG